MLSNFGGKKAAPFAKREAKNTKRKKASEGEIKKTLMKKGK